MANLNARVQAALGWAYGAILGATYEGASTAEIWEALRAGAANAGLETVGLSGADVSILRGYAGQIVAAQRNLESGDPGALIDNSMIGRAPWSADLNQLAASPEYWARVEMTVADEAGNLSTGWGTITGIDTLAMTKREFDQMVAINAEALALGQGPGGTPTGILAGIGRVELIVAPGS